MSPRACVALGAFLAAAAVALGALGAHWLEGQVPIWFPEPARQQRMLDTWEVGVRYQMYSALGIILAGLLAMQQGKRNVLAAPALFLAGTIVFSGLLYLMVLAQVKVGAIVAFGGLAMIAGWVVLAWSAFSTKKNQ